MRLKMEHKLTDNLLIFARGLRLAGVKVGAGEVMVAVHALQITGINTKRDFYDILHTCFIKRHEDSLIFSEAFALFFKKRGLLEKMMEILLPQTKIPPQAQKKEAGATRINEAFFPKKNFSEEKTEIESDAADSYSAEELLNNKDFAQMSAAEMNEAFARIRRLVLPQDDHETRRFKADIKGSRVDLRASLRGFISDSVMLKLKSPRREPPPLVILADISGSMSAYSRVLLHFAHALMQIRKNVHVFTFGTRLTQVTRALKHKDIDLALIAASRLVPDWGGGTRMASCLHAFNKDYARRVLSGGAIVLLVTDGLEREDLDKLEGAAARLSRMSRRLIWLNPLLRYSGFEAKARGIKLLMPLVDEFRAVHNLSSIAELVKALGGKNVSRIFIRTRMAENR
jgi:uncharacterized protein